MQESGIYFLTLTLGQDWQGQVCSDVGLRSKGLYLETKESIPACAARGATIATTHTRLVHHK